MGVTRYCLSLSFYEQLKLPFLTILTEGVVLNEKKIGQLTKANFWLYLTEKIEYNGKPRHKNSFLTRN